MRTILALFVLVFAFYWKLTVTGGEFVWFDHPDMCYLELPRLEYQAREFHRSRFPLWDPHIWMGQPLIGQTQPGPLNPLNVAFLLLPLDPQGYLRWDFLNWYFVVLHLIAALGFYLLCRYLRRSPAASLLGAAAFSFGGFVGSVPWLDVLNGAIWTPYVALFFLRGSPALCGVFLGLTWLSGHHELPLLTSLALAAASAYTVWRRGRAAIAPAAIAFLIAGLVSAAQMWPTLEFGRLAKRWGPAGGPVGWHDTIPYVSSSIYSLTPRSLIGIALPDQGTNADSSAFLGVVAIALAALGLLSAWRLAPVKWFAALAAGAAIYSLGAFTPVHGWLLTALPMLNKARVPSRGTHLLNFALAVLTAYGADQFLRSRARRWAARIGAAAAIAGVMILSGAVVWKIDFSEAMVLCGIVGIAFFALTRVRPASPTATAAMLLLLMLAELHTVFTRPWQSRFEENNPQRYARSLRSHAAIVQFLRDQPGPTRVRVNDQAIPTNFGDLHSIDMLEGYTAGVTANLLHYARHTEWAQRLFSVTHYIGREPDLPNLELAHTGREDGVNVYRVTNPVPRARAVHAVESLTSPVQLAPRLEDPAFDPRRTVFLINEKPALEACDPAGDTVAVAAYAPNRVRLKATLACRGMVILADTFFPGWQATVDGREARIWEAYGALRGVIVDAGAHEVDFRYRPVSVTGGFALTAGGIFAALAITVAGRRRKLA